MICFVCKLPIKKHFFKVDGWVYHPECTRCAYCRNPLSDNYQSEKGLLYHPLCYQQKKGLFCVKCGEVLGAKWVVFEHKNYHKDCLEPLIQDKCDYCGKGLVGRYYIDHWGQKIHASHRLSRCDSCHRFLVNRRDGARLPDGRYQCKSCHAQAIKSPSDVKILTNKVLAGLHSMQIHGVPVEVPVYLLDLNAMKKLSRTHSDNPKGLTKTHIKKMAGLRNLSHEIFVLYGLPKVEFMGVLAHEFMHVWIHENGIKLSAAQTEGICNLATFFVYSQDKGDLAQYLLEAMQKNPDPIYGQGYRSMLAHVKSRGWKTFLEDLLQHKNLNKSLWRRIFGK